MNERRGPPKIKYVIYNLDKPASADLRADARADHLAFMVSLGDRVTVGGPILADDGQTAIGGMFVLEAATLADAERTAAQDPFVKAGLFASTSVRPWRLQTSNI